MMWDVALVGMFESLNNSKKVRCSVLLSVQNVLPQAE